MDGYGGEFWTLPYSYTYFYVSVKTFGYLDIIYISTQTPDSDLMWLMTPHS